MFAKQTCKIMKTNKREGIFMAKKNGKPDILYLFQREISLSASLNCFTIKNDFMDTGVQLLGSFEILSSLYDRAIHTAYPDYTKIPEDEKSLQKCIDFVFSQKDKDNKKPIWLTEKRISFLCVEKKKFVNDLQNGILWVAPERSERLKTEQFFGNVGTHNPRYGMTSSIDKIGGMVSDTSIHSNDFFKNTLGSHTSNGLCRNDIAPSDAADSPYLFLISSSLNKVNLNFFGIFEEFMSKTINEIRDSYELFLKNGSGKKTVEVPAGPQILVPKITSEGICYIAVSPIGSKAVFENLDTKLDSLEKEAKRKKASCPNMTFFNKYLSNKQNFFLNAPSRVLISIPPTMNSSIRKFNDFYFRQHSFFDYIKSQCPELERKLLAIVKMQQKIDKSGIGGKNSNRRKIRIGTIRNVTKILAENIRPILAENKVSFPKDLITNVAENISSWINTYIKNKKILGRKHIVQWENVKASWLPEIKNTLREELEDLLCG